MLFKNLTQNSQLKTTLHVTSEQKTAATISASALEGEVLVWQDALYEGPLVEGQSLNELSSIRAEYFSRLGWGEYSEIMRLFSQRNGIISHFLKYSEIVLWFDSGLNNQLQLIQLINWFSKQQTQHVIISIVSKGRLSDVVGFVDYAMLNESQIESLYKTKTELTNSQTALCNNAWEALTSDNPSELLNFFPRDMTSMPYLKNAILRFVQQFPTKNNGLCKTEQLIIYAMKTQKKTESSLSETLEEATTVQSLMEQIYLNAQGKEPIPFMSRAIFYAYLKNMMTSEQPIILKSVIEQTEVLQINDDEGDDVVMEEVVIESKVELKLTKVSGQITNNWVDWVQLNGIDRWLGGVHLQEGNVWRYNAQTRQLMKTYV